MFASSGEGGSLAGPTLDRIVRPGNRKKVNAVGEWAAGTVAEWGINWRYSDGVSGTNSGRGQSREINDDLAKYH